MAYETPPKKKGGSILRLVQTLTIGVVLGAVLLAPQTDYFKGMVGGEKLDEKVQEVEDQALEGALVLTYLDVEDEEIANIEIVAEFAKVEITQLLLFVDGVSAEDLTDIKVVCNDEQLDADRVSADLNHILIMPVDVTLEQDETKNLKIYANTSGKTPYSLQVIDVQATANGQEVTNIGVLSNPHLVQ